MKNSILLILIVFTVFSGFGQKKSAVFNETKLKTNPAVRNYSISDVRQTPSLIVFKDNSNFNATNVVEFLKDVLGVKDENYNINQDKSLTTKSGSDVIYFTATYNGVKLEHVVYKALIKNNKVSAISLEHYNLDVSITHAAAISNDQARQRALNHVGADVYVWEVIGDNLDQTVNITEVEELQNSFNEHYPHGELTYIDNYNTAEGDLTLAYKFNIYASEPLYRANVYVDATTGEVLLADAIIKHADEINKKREEVKTNSRVIYAATAGGDTRYAGNRQFETTIDTSDPLNTRYSLDGTIDISAFISDPTLQTVLNETRSYDGVGGAPVSVGGIPSYSIYDGFSRTEEGQTIIEVGDNNWSAGEHWRKRFDVLTYPADNETKNDDIALDAHWGAEVVIRYWADVHGRSSYDNLGTKIINYVHYGDAYDNAFWNGTAMTYGDGSSQGGTNPNGSFAPLTSMDVCGHEIGHGVCSATSDLVYARESGAMNEGFSDIWAAAVEQYVLVNIDGSLPYDPWGIGEQIDDRDGGAQPGDPDARALRWMDDPKASGDPDTYGGSNWQEPECGEPTLANDQCGVHTNSGVLNKWFYLMAIGSGQAFSPGSGKSGSDDELNDLANVYSVQALGYDKAEQIAFQGELLLTPNAKFKDMRDASILVAETLYGNFSNEVIQVTNAWYAVGIGAQYISPGDNIVFFNADNLNAIEEGTALEGCNETNVFTIDVTAVNVVSPQTINVDFSNSTASADDYTVSSNSLTFSTDGTQSITITVFNDGIVEGSETIVAEFVNGTDSRAHSIVIKDDDYTPSLGFATIELVNETFDTTDMPTNWYTESAIGLDPNIWKFNGTTPDAIGKAYVENRQTADGGPNYNQAQDGNLLLITDVIDARGISDVSLSFDWVVGGETEPADGSVLYDYGELLYSFDGANFVSLETFVAVLGIEVTASGTYNELLSVLDNTQFQIAWRWYNDALAGTAYSIAIDNVIVVGTPALVELDVADSDSETVKAGNQIYFISDQDAGVIGIIENASADLGCVSMEVSTSGSATNFSNLAASHAGKTIQIDADGIDAPTATYDLTLFFTDAELTDFTDPDGLQIIKVDGNSIDEATDSPSTNYVISGGILETNATQQYRSYKGTFTGNSVFGLVAQETLSDSQFEISEFKVFPTVIDQVETLHILNSKTPIEKVDVYTIQGKLVKSVSFDNVNSVDLPISQLTSGMYFIKINNNLEAFKFVVK